MAEINVGQISEALNDKADRDLNNVTTHICKKGQIAVRGYIR